MQEYIPLLPAVMLPETTAKAPTSLAPPRLSEQPVTVALPLPVLRRTAVHTASVAPVHVVTDPDTSALVVKDPKRPNTKPAMATAAMRVMAIRMTVARTGEMAFLFPFWKIFIFVISAKLFCL